VKLDPATRRAAFVSLASVAIVSLVVAVVVVLMAVKGVQWWLIGCLSALVLVIAAEIVLLVLDRQKEDEAYEFVIEGDAEESPR
jgi:hypothetical protein